MKKAIYLFLFLLLGVAGIVGHHFYKLHVWEAQFLGTYKTTEGGSETILELRDGEFEVTGSAVSCTSGTWELVVTEEKDYLQLECVNTWGVQLVVDKEAFEGTLEWEYHENREYFKFERVDN